jgi:diguanylate cyclase (GGDEF)-like protein
MRTPKLDDEAGRLAALGRYEILDTGREEAFEQIVQLVQRVFGVPIATVTLVDADRLWIKAHVGFAATELPRDKSFCNHVIANSDGLAVEDAAHDPRFADMPQVAEFPKLRSYLGAPLRTPDGYHIGVVCIVSDTPRLFSNQDRDIMRRFADFVMTHIELRQLANHDSLTGVMTRRAFDRKALDVIRIYSLDAKPHALALLDIDHFKRINDAHGHACGDAMLKAVADSLRLVVGPQAFIGRLGGEEFGVLLPNANPAKLQAEGEALREAVATAVVKGLPTITASVGVAALLPAFVTMDSWLRVADRALYAAKAGGRNQVVVG